jgi:hypothetical protein
MARTFSDFNLLTIRVGEDLGCLPLPKINALKYWGQMIFRNTLEHQITRKPLSMPPLKSDYAQWDVPLTLKDDVRRGPESMFGRNKVNQELEKFRICWSVSSFFYIQILANLDAVVVGRL